MEHTIYDLDEIEYQIREYKQRADHLRVLAIFIDDKPLVRRDRVLFICKECKKEIKISPENFASRGGKKICKSCRLSEMRINLDMSLIKKLYIEKEMSTLDIAELLNTTKKNILFRLKKMNIDRRGASEAAKLKIKNHPELHPGKFAHLGALGNSGKNSKPELYMKAILEKKKLNFKFQKVVKINTKRSKVFDFWLEDYNTFIEVDGDYWHYNKNNPKINNRLPNKAQLKKKISDQEKNDYCKREGIKLIRIWESELEDKAQLIIESL